MDYSTKIYKIIDGEITPTNDKELNSNDIYIGRDFIDLTIQGAGAQYTIVQAETSKNVAGDRVFHVAWNNTVALKDMTIRYGQHSSGAAGIYNEGSLTLTNCTISDNVTNDKGGGIYSIYGGLTMTNCTVNGNSSAYDGAGIYSYGEILIMTNCTIAETQILIADMVALDFVAGAVL